MSFVTPRDAADVFKLPGLNDLRNDTLRLAESVLLLLILMKDVSISSSELQPCDRLSSSLLQVGDASESVSIDGDDVVMIGISNMISWSSFCVSLV